MAACGKCGGGLLPNLAELGHHIGCATDEQIDAWWRSNPATTGLARKAEGQALAADAAPDDWTDRFRSALRELAATGEPFTSEDVTDRAGLPAGGIGTNRNNAVGALMASAGAARPKLIRKTGRHVPSRRPSSHAATLTEWIGV